jgi:hypothetical protein
VNETFEFLATVRIILEAENVEVAERIVRGDLEQIAYEIESVEVVK